jgi:hypothetical protein
MWEKYKAWLKSKADILERGAWTALQVVTAVGVQQWFDLDETWVPVIAVILAFIKGAAATRFGNGSAATLPSDVEPVPAAVVEEYLEGE